jgi:hypothetical protein
MPVSPASRVEYAGRGVSERFAKCRLGEVLSGFKNVFPGAVSHYLRQEPIEVSQNILWLFPPKQTPSERDQASIHLNF